MIRIVKGALYLFLGLVLTGCFGSGSSSRYSMDQDEGPSGRVDLTHVPDAVPRVEPKSRGGNKSPYTVWGKQYYVLNSADGYRQQGTASWYGKKFHGHKTSNGETYDMYQMSAAHKSLPLPSYVKVTNLNNGRSVVVRVNDRGPFHGSRIIDLSYAAAFKLDMLKSGTARVEVETITPGNYSTAALSPPVPVAAPAIPASVNTGYVKSGPVANPGQYVQVGAYSSWGAAQSVKTRLQALVNDLSVVINKREGVVPLYRVQLGPVGRTSPLDGLFATLRSAGFPDPRVVDLP